MIPHVRICLLVSVLALAGCQQRYLLAEGTTTTIQPKEVKAFCASMLQQGRQLVQDSQVAQAVVLYEQACQVIVSSLGTTSDEGYLAGQALQAAAARSEEDKLGLFQEHLEQIKKVSGFRPILEAKLPVGFPAPSSPGLIRIKEYPALRMARVGDEQTAGSADSRFGVLFRHIQGNGIPMTAPVCMELQVPGTTGDTGAIREESMAFYYPSTDAGVPGKAGDVQVLDTPPQTVVSCASQGSYTAKSYAPILQTLEQWLQDNSDAYRRAGSTRILAYNSPFMPSFLKYFEVQIPIAKVPPRPQDASP